jgi:GntR family transcriptional regulator/MocR family aminotransferase
MQPTTSGFHTTARLADTIREQDVVAQAAAQGVTIPPVQRYCLTPVAQSGLVFGFGSATPEDITRGIDIVRDLSALR